MFKRTSILVLGGLILAQVALGMRIGPDDGGRQCFELRMEEFYSALQYFKKDCGRYPTTAEGLSMLIQKPKDLKCRDLHWEDNPEVICKKIKEIDALSCEPKDCYGVPFVYESDGKTFYLKGSHGYSVSDKTTAKEYGKHWDNPNPPPIPSYPPIPEPSPGGDVY
jgi:hypothetical protein